MNASDYPPINFIINKVISTILLLITAWYLIDFPYHPVLLGFALVIYFIVFQIFTNCWLIVVPALLPLLYLAPFSGRLFFDEFDLLIIFTIAGYLWKNKKVPKSSLVISNGGKILLFFFLFCLCNSCNKRAFTFFRNQ